MIDLEAKLAGCSSQFQSQTVLKLSASFDKGVAKNSPLTDCPDLPLKAVSIDYILSMRQSKGGNFIYPMMHRFKLYYQASERT